MTTRSFDIGAVKEQLREALTLVEAGFEVILTAGDTPLARLLPIDQALKQRIPGLHPGAIRMSDDFDKRLPQFGSAKGLIDMADDFDETPADFAEYTR